MVLEPWSLLTIVQLASSLRQSVPNRVKFHVLLQLIQPRDGNFQQDDSVLRNVKTGFLERSLNVLFFFILDRSILRNRFRRFVHGQTRQQ